MQKNILLLLVLLFFSNVDLVALKVLSFESSLFLLNVSHALAQQTIKVEGKVTDETGEALVGVSISVKGDEGKSSLSAVPTNASGVYTIEAKSGDVLVFSYIGFKSQEFRINDKTHLLDVVMQQDFTDLDELVVVGYGQLKKNDLTGAVTSISGENVNTLPLADPVQGLQGKIAGMQVLNSSGEPGVSPIIRLRGISTLNNNNPLFVVDGVIVDVAQQSSGSSLDFINANDISSIEVLKDASATSIFGARGSNGVILITSKQGKQGVGKINFNMEEGVEILAKKIPLMNSLEFGEYINAIKPGTYNNLEALPNVDWQDEIFNSLTSIRNYSLSFSGGSKLLSYYSSFGYYYQQGILSKSSLERITGKVSLDFRVKKYLKIGTSINLASYDKKHAPGVTNTAYTSWPIDLPRDEDGNFLEVQGGGNALADIEYSNSSRKNLRALTNLFLELEPIAGLTVKSSLQFDLDLAKSTSFTPEFFVSALQQNPTSDIDKEFSNLYQIIWENTISYNKQWGRHRINAVVGYTVQERVYEFLRGHTENLLSNDKLFWYLNGGEINGAERSLNNEGEHSAMLSMLYRLNYVYKDKYLFTLTGRRDASSNFGSTNKAGFFPSVALGWNIHEESFFPSNQFLQNLKLRVSWGIVGNEKINFRDQYSTISSGLGAVFNDKLTAGASFSSPGNPDLKWEETEQFDIGLQFTSKGGKLSGEFDYYIKTTKDILVNLTALGYMGLGPSSQFRANAADVRNNGFEFSLLWQHQMGDFYYKIGANASIIKNEVTKLGETGADSVLIGGSLNDGKYVTRTIVGQPIGFFYGYEAIGVFQTQEQLDNTPSTFEQGVGDLIYADQNGDGEIDEKDNTFLGSPIPDFIYGFNAEINYKGIGLAFVFQGQLGNYIYNGKVTVRDFSQLNYEKRFANRWTEDNPTNEYFRASRGGVNFRPSSYYLEDASFLRLRTLTLSYSFPQKILDRIKLDNLKIYLRATNLFTLTDFTGYSPDVGSANPLDGVIDNGIYPQTRVFTIGMNLKF